MTVCLPSRLIRPNVTGSHVIAYGGLGPHLCTRCVVLGWLRSFGLP